MSQKDPGLGQHLGQYPSKMALQGIFHPDDDATPCLWMVCHTASGLILGLHPANERHKPRISPAALDANFSGAMWTEFKIWFHYDYFYHISYQCDHNQILHTIKQQCCLGIWKTHCDQKHFPKKNYLTMLSLKYRTFFLGLNVSISPCLFHDKYCHH